MKNLICMILICYGGITFAAPVSNWNGFYVGGNAGYWNSVANHVTTTSDVSYINPADVTGAGNIANALAHFANNSSSLNAYGLLLGAQAGYNYDLRNGFVLGVNADFDGATNANNNISMHKTVNLVDYNESYNGSINISQRINYLGTVRARLGYLYNPTLLFYVTGGLGFGSVTLDSKWTAQESLGSAIYPAVTSHNNVNNTLYGWTAGAGAEWLFKPNWSSTIEYDYYSLSNLDATTTLAQFNTAVTPTALWGSVSAKTKLTFSVWSIKVGLNYHFL